MAGNHPKKSTVERRDSNFGNKQQQQHQQQRKNSAGVKKDSSSNTNVNINNTNKEKSIMNQQQQKAAGAAILSAVTSPQSASTASGAEQKPVGLNGFNRGELVEFLNMRFSDALTAYHDTNLDPKIRPEKYEPPATPVPAVSAKIATTDTSTTSTTSAWNKGSNGIISAWGQQSQQQPAANTNTQQKSDTGIMANGIDFLSELSIRSSSK